MRMRVCIQKLLSRAILEREDKYMLSPTSMSFMMPKFLVVFIQLSDPSDLNCAVQKSSPEGLFDQTFSYPPKWRRYLPQSHVALSASQCSRRFLCFCVRKKAYFSYSSIPICRSFTVLCIWQRQKRSNARHFAAPERCYRSWMPPLTGVVDWHWYEMASSQSSWLYHTVPDRGESRSNCMGAANPIGAVSLALSFFAERQDGPFLNFRERRAPGLVDAGAV